MNAIFLMPVNLYGPRDNFDQTSSHVIPALICKCVEAVDNRRDEIVCWGDGSASREFLYVEDCAAGIVAAARWYNQPDPVNLGSGREISIGELAHAIAEITGFRGRILWDNSKPNGQPRRCLDVSRARREFGFQARTELREGLRRTIEWYLAVRSTTAPVLV
jgi:GDP-L-fucose synthase